MPTSAAVARVVVDPNVLVSAAITSGTSRSVVDAASTGVLVIVVCPLLVAELTAVLARERFERWRTRDRLDRYVADIISIAEHHPDPCPIAAVTRDPGDDYLVALAAAADAVICSGDRDLHAAAIDVAVFTPGELIERVATR
ncbi:MAG: putative toxin-antitoxin system toxin component, PIN family [Acidimicrobiia bacterium]